MSATLGLSDVLDELGDDEFPGYFDERDGRLFVASHLNSPYPLPVHTPEQQRLNLVHRTLFRLIGAHFVGHGPGGPVEQVLANEPNRQKIALDLGCGTGKWVMKMGELFPHVLFRGLDIVPIATRYPHQNILFELHDINERTTWANSSVDFIHARNIAMTTQNYPGIIDEVARILRPGGLFISGEWDTSLSFLPNFPEQSLPANDHFSDILRDALEQYRGLSSISTSVAPWLADSGRFNQITPQRFYMPVGDWPTEPEVQRIGKDFQTSYLMYSESVRPLLMESGQTEEDLKDLHATMKAELDEAEGLVLVYHTVHARKA
ncbi:S-adenosyl-L-methionine-dependent methyltransferase [Mycena floridula]|nr:S-adenosyl-L-methionine-dependent methyltransferase [Mycena floridula]